MPAAPSRATLFLLAALAWSLGLFALLRAPGVEERLVLPLTRLQTRAAEHYGGRPPVPVAVTADCSGTDVLALCLAVILACPVPWRARLAGVVGGIALVLAVNTLRIATLGRAVASPALFEALHLRVWPSVLVLATSGYVFAWLWLNLGTRGEGQETPRGGDVLSRVVRAFLPRAAVLLVVFALCAPWIARSPALREAGVSLVSSAAFLLRGTGVAATASGNVLTTSRGAFVVTPECIGTALIPLYFAGVLAVRLSWPQRVLALAAAPPLFALLALARLLVLALPPALVASPLFLVHGFHQLVLALVGVLLLALWREPPTPGRWARAARRAGAALGVAAVLGAVLGHSLATVVLVGAEAIASLGPRVLTDLVAPGDSQGALALLPAYQAGLLLAIGVAAFPGWRRLVSAFGLLVVSQVTLLAFLGELAARGVVAHPLFVRAWAVAVPVVLALALWCTGPPLPGALSPPVPAADDPA